VNAQHRHPVGDDVMKIPRDAQAFYSVLALPPTPRKSVVTPAGMVCALQAVPFQCRIIVFRPEHVLVVQVGRGEDLDGIELRLPDHLVETLETGRYPTDRGELVRLVEAGAGEGDKVAPVVVRIAGDVQLCDVPYPGYSDA